MPNMMTPKDLNVIQSYEEGISLTTKFLLAYKQFLGPTAWVALKDIPFQEEIPGKIEGQQPIDNSWVNYLATKFESWFAPTVFPMVGVADFEDQGMTWVF